MTNIDTAGARAIALLDIIAASLPEFANAVENCAEVNFRPIDTTGDGHNASLLCCARQMRHFREEALAVLAEPEAVAVVKVVEAAEEYLTELDWSREVAGDGEVRWFVPALQSWVPTDQAYRVALAEAKCNCRSKGLYDPSYKVHRPDGCFLTVERWQASKVPPPCTCPDASHFPGTCP